MGNKMASGRGELAPEEQTSVGFKTQRGKVPTQSGAIIGQFFFEGEQVQGEVSSALIRVRSAVERQASDRTNRDRVPRQYQDAVRTYFSGVQRSLDAAESKKKGKNENAQSLPDNGSS